MPGYVHVYTGNGKGKTTAALGLALRAAGAGLKVFIGQFAKGVDTSELHSIERFGDLIEIKQYGSGRFLRRGDSEKDRLMARDAMDQITEVVASGVYDLVVLDEINIATYMGLIDTAAVLDLIASKPDGVELVMTGRYADPRVIEQADLVTEMREVKHYYHQGIAARVGIET